MSTRKSQTRVAECWIKYLEGTEGVDPTIHGLSEVQLFAEEMRGYWRIHSNDAIVEFDYCATDPVSGGPPQHKEHFGRRIPGCLHYLMLPLRSPQLPIIYRQPIQAPQTKLHMVDAAEHVLGDHPKPISEMSSQDWSMGIGAFCQQIADAASGTNTAPTVINLTLFDEIPEKHRQPSFALVADAIHRFRSSLPLFIWGASKPTRSLLKRFLGSQKNFFDSRVLPFLDLYAPEYAELNIQVECGDQILPVKEKLEQALHPAKQDQILMSDAGLERWKLLYQVEEHNGGLFSIVDVGLKDKAFVGRVKVDPEHATSKHFLFGGRSSKQFVAMLKDAQAIDVKHRFLRLGREMKSYIHLARLWAEPRYVSDIMNWLALTIQNILQRHYGQTSDSSTNEGLWQNVDIVATLHPAIDMAHGLATHPFFHDARIIEIRHLADLRWDSEPLIQLAGRRKIVCLFDILENGETARRLVDALNYTEAHAVAIVSILDFGQFKPSEDTIVASFSEISREAVESKT